MLRYSNNATAHVHDYTKTYLVLESLWVVIIGRDSLLKPSYHTLLLHKTSLLLQPLILLTSQPSIPAWREHQMNWSLNKQFVSLALIPCTCNNCTIEWGEPEWAPHKQYNMQCTKYIIMVYKEWGAHFACPLLGLFGLFCAWTDTCRHDSHVVSTHEGYRHC